MSFFKRAGSDSESSSSDESEEELLQSSDEENGNGSDAGLKATAAKASSGKAGGAPAKSKGSKFLKGAASSDSSDDDSSESDSDSDDSDKAAGSGDDDGAKPKKKKGASKFLKGSKSDDSSDDGADSDDDSDQETVKIVKSAKTKKNDEMEGCEKAIVNAQRIGDWASVNSEYDKLARLSAPLPGSNSSLYPPVYLRVILNLEDSLSSTSTAGTGEGKNKKKMNATAARGLTAIKQKIKKVTRENEAVLGEYKQDKDAYAKKFDGGPAVSAATGKKASKLQKGTAEGEADTDEFMTVGKGGKALAFGASGEGVFKNLQIILEARGKKNTDRADQLKALNRLYTEQAESTYAKIRVLLVLVSSYFDYAASTSGGIGSGGYMPLEAWSSARERLNELLTILITQNASYTVQEVVSQEYDDLEERAPNQNGEGPVVAIRGNVVSLVERLDDEFNKSLQNIDPHASEYVDRLKDEKLVYDTILRGISYFEAAKENGGKGPDGESALSRCLLRRLEHIYSKPDIVVAALEGAISSDIKTELFPQRATAATSPALTRAICIHLYKAAGQRVRTRAMLCHIYHCALHDDYYTARNMFNMSNVQSDVLYAEVETQGLFNRTLVQLGLCAFRVGLIEESEQTLREIVQTQRVRELLFQGLPTGFSRSNIVLTPEQEKIEKSRQLPFHMHINLELLECVYLVSSMLIEVPQLAKEDANPELRKQVSSRTFRRMFDHSERQAFTGPPENKRDHVIQASKALLGGDWKLCTELITSIKVWSLLPNEGKIKEMLSRKIQEQALRTYLFTSARFYTSMSLSHLCDTLSLPQSTVTPIVARMIWDEELAGSLDQSTSILTLQRVERTPLQSHAMDLLEKAEQMVRLLGHARPGDRNTDDAGKDGASGGGDGQGGQRRGGHGGERRRGGGYRGGRGRGGAAQFGGPIRAN